MKHNTLKKILSLLLVISMMASFGGCVPGEEDPTDPSTIETTGSTENTTVPTDGTTAPTEPTEAETDPPATEVPNTDPTFATEVPTESPVETFVDVVETVYAISTVNVRSGPSTDDMIVGYLNYTVVRSGELCNGSGKNLWCHRRIGWQPRTENLHRNQWQSRRHLDRCL